MECYFSPKNLIHKENVESIDNHPKHKLSLGRINTSYLQKGIQKEVLQSPSQRRFVVRKLIHEYVSAPSHVNIKSSQNKNINLFIANILRNCYFSTY